MDEAVAAPVALSCGCTLGYSICIGSFMCLSGGRSLRNKNPHPTVKCALILASGVVILRG